MSGYVRSRSEYQKDKEEIIDLVDESDVKLDNDEEPTDAESDDPEEFIGM